MPEIAPPVVLTDDLQSVESSRRPRRSILREAGLLVLLYALYSLVRNIAPDRVGAADAHARSLLGLERLLNLNVELSINNFFADHTWLAVGSNYFYATLFIPVVLVVLVWLWITQPERYAKARWILLVMTVMALVCYLLYPMTPPRLLPAAGYNDTVITFETWGLSAAERPKGVSNEYAAMPSMHFGWSLWCGIAIAKFATVPWQKVVAVLYPTLTLIVIIATANHFVLDAVAGAFAFAVAIVLCGPVWDRVRPLSRQVISSLR
jgi:PAP2 superfamily